MKKLGINILIFSLTLACMLFVTELYLQLTEIELAYHELHPNIGKKISENKRIIMLKEGFYLGGSNKYGFLGPAYTKEKKEDVFRIALMGDSYTEGFQLFERHHFRQVMEDALNKNSGKEVQVLNFGVAGFDFIDMYIYYMNYASSFNPDLVIYIVRPNDIAAQQKLIPAPYISLVNDKLVMNYNFRYSSRYKMYKKYKLIIENSSYFKLANNIYFLIKKGIMPQIIFDKFYTTLYGPMRDPSKTSRIKRENALKRRISTSFNSMKVSRKVIEELGKNGNVYLAYRTDFPDNIHNFIVNAGIKTINLNPPLNDLEKKGIDPIYWKASGLKGHWNHEAHHAIGTYLAEILRPEIKSVKSAF